MKRGNIIFNISLVIIGLLVIGSIIIFNQELGIRLAPSRSVNIESTSNNQNNLLINNDTYYSILESNIVAKVNNDVEYLHRDRLGSNIATTGNDLKRNKNLPFGQEISNDGITYSFTGKELDDNDLYYFVNRYYNPDSGRFLETDSVYSNPSYVYANNNPLLYVDPDGRDAVINRPWQIDFINNLKNRLPFGLGKVTPSGEDIVLDPFNFNVGMAVLGSTSKMGVKGLFKSIDKESLKSTIKVSPSSARRITVDPKINLGSMNVFEINDLTVNSRTMEEVVGGIKALESRGLIKSKGLIKAQSSEMSKKLGSSNSHFLFIENEKLMPLSEAHTSMSPRNIEKLIVHLSEMSKQGVFLKGNIAENLAVTDNMAFRVLDPTLVEKKDISRISKHLIRDKLAGQIDDFMNARAGALGNFEGERDAMHSFLGMALSN